MHKPSWCEGVPEPVRIKRDMKNGEKFMDDEDIDRMKENFSFDPISPEPRDMSVEVMPNPDSWYKTERYLAFVRNVLSQEECLQIIAKCNEKQFSPSLINIGRGRQQYIPQSRSGLRCIIDDENFARSLQARLAEHIPPKWDSRGVSGINERLRVLCYEKPCDSFEAHFDGCYTRPMDHPKAGDSSKITIQIYLNTVPEGCGGYTTLFPDSENPIRVKPEMGAVLLFSQQNVYHEGTALTCDGLKYALRTEVMYTRG